jgi:hypothetical protein
MSNVGRISGPLLKANLERKGIDLAFETNMLYLDVQCRKIGVGKKVICTPSTADLEVINTGLRTTDINIEFPTTVNGVTLGVDSITSTNNSDFVIESPQLITVPKLVTDDLTFSTNKIQTTQPNSSVDINPSGTGRTNFGATTNVAGNVFIDGNAVYFTTTLIDPVPQAEVDDLTSNIKPSINNTGSVGNADYTWDQAYFETLQSSNVVIPTVPPGISVFLTLPGNSYYVSSQGSDTNQGTIQLSPFRTLAKALSVATAGSTIFITSGTYTEIFPLTVPAGVAIIGQSIRSVIIQPTAGTIDKDAFLLNNETSVEDLTVSGFRFNSSNNTGYAFRFANNIAITTKSPYIRNVSVITKGSNITLSDPLSYDTNDAGKGAYIDGSVVDSSSISASMLFYAVTFITPGVDAITMTNGARVEAIDTFTYYANKGFNATQGTVGFSRFDATIPASITVGPAPTGLSYSSNSVSLSKTFYSQALVDSLVGQIAVIDRYPSAPLFYTVVSIVTDPDIPSLWRMTVDTTFNTAGQLKPISFYPDIATTQIVTNDIWDTTGASVGEKWVAYYKTNLPSFFDTTVGANWSIDVAGTIYIVDYVIEDPVNPTMWRIYVTTSLVGGVGIPIFTSPGGIIKIYGSETRCISCANVYGKYGFVGDGASVLAYLIGHNFAYIGTEKDSSNDKTLRVQANETVELNSAKINYVSTDQGGDFRIGDNFLVNFKKGTTSFSSESFDLSGLSVITINNGVSTTVLAPYKVESNNFRFSGSTIETLSGPANFKTATGIFLLDDNVNVGKNLAVSGVVDFKGTITVGNQSTDTVTIAMDLNQDIIPDLGDTYNLGSSSKRWINSWIGRVDLPSLTIDNNVITALNTDLNLIGNGTGGVVVDSLIFTDNVLSANTGVDIKLKPTSNYILYLDSNSSLRLPSGSSANKPIMNSGEIRYDNVLNQFVGQKNFRTALGGVYSANRNTRVLAHPTNNTIPFVINNSTVASIAPTAFLANSINVDQITVSSNTISVSGSNNLNLSNTGTSYVMLNNIKFDGDDIINDTDNPIVLPATLTRWIKFDSTKAIIVPVHNLTEPASDAIGTIRYNPDTQCMEVWDGDSFDNFGGVGGNATEDDVEQLTNLWTLILG